jgi:flavorubredoxin
MEQGRIINKDIYYVGVNDRMKSSFEGMWPLPYGISYNSYLIVDDIITLIDTVDISFFERFLREIHSIIGDRPINYLVINHMEPDHSGAITLIKQAYPDIVIVGNKQTFGMIEGYYGISGEKYEVKHGDFLSLGHHTLRFFLTPMVHWPETMMTFDEESGTLFSGDAFGCYGTLDGGYIDRQMDTARYRNEMIRYYANIVGKYGSPVQSALNKLSGIEIKTICSTHGPVWEEQKDEVVALYNRLSLYQAEEGVVIAYGSMYGHTEEMAEVIAGELSAEGIRHIIIHNVSRTNSSYILRDIFKYKGLIIGSPTYCNQIYPDVESLLSKIAVRDIKDRYLGYFGSFTWAGAAVRRITEWAEKSKMEIVGDPAEMKQAMNDIALQKCKALGRAMAERLKKDREG